MDEILHQEARNTVQALIKDKKKTFAKKATWKYRKIKWALENVKKLGLPDKKAPTKSICLNTKNDLTFSPRTIANTFKKHFANLASHLVKKFLGPKGKFGIPSMRQH